MARKEHEKPDNRILIGRTLHKSEEQFWIIQPEITPVQIFIIMHISHSKVL